jgi:hypothetical protein
MPRMRVVLDDVFCGNPEDVTSGWWANPAKGEDDFYLMDTVTDGDQTTGVLTSPFHFKENQTKKFGEGGGTVFEKTCQKIGS